MTIDWSVVLLVILCGWNAWNILFSPTALTRSHRDVMAHMRKANAKRGITMRPNWWYHMPDGESHMSPTGREKDMVVRKTKKFGGP